MAASRIFLEHQTDLVTFMLKNPSRISTFRLSPNFSAKHSRSPHQASLPATQHPAFPTLTLRSPQTPAAAGNRAHRLRQLGARPPQSDGWHVLLRVSWENLGKRLIVLKPPHLLHRKPGLTLPPLPTSGPLSLILPATWVCCEDKMRLRKTLSEEPGQVSMVNQRWLGGAISRGGAGANSGCPGGRDSEGLFYFLLHMSC